MAAEFWKTSPRLLNWALHAASGIVIAIVAVELIPEALGTLAGWWIAVAFAAGGLAYMALEWLTERLQPRAAGGGDGRTSTWMIYVAVAVDLTRDRPMIGSGSAVSAHLALVLAACLVLAHPPDGYATAPALRHKGQPAP